MRSPIGTWWSTPPEGHAERRTRGRRCGSTGALCRVRGLFHMKHRQTVSAAVSRETSALGDGLSDGAGHSPRRPKARDNTEAVPAQTRSGELPDPGGPSLRTPGTTPLPSLAYRRSGAPDGPTPKALTDTGERGCVSRESSSGAGVQNPVSGRWVLTPSSRVLSRWGSGVREGLSPAEPGWRGCLCVCSPSPPESVLCRAMKGSERSVRASSEMQSRSVFHVKPGRLVAMSTWLPPGLRFGRAKVGRRRGDRRGESVFVGSSVCRHADEPSAPEVERFLFHVKQPVSGCWCFT